MACCPEERCMTVLRTDQTLENLKLSALFPLRRATWRRTGTIFSIRPMHFATAFSPTRGEARLSSLPSSPHPEVSNAANPSVTVSSQVEESMVHFCNPEECRQPVCPLGFDFTAEPFSSASAFAFCPRVDFEGPSLAFYAAISALMDTFSSSLDQV